MRSPPPDISPTRELEAQEPWLAAVLSPKGRRQEPQFHRHHRCTMSCTPRTRRSLSDCFSAGTPWACWSFKRQTPDRRPPPCRHESRPKRTADFTYTYEAREGGREAEGGGLLRPQRIKNGPEIDDFRPVFYWWLGWHWVPNDGPWTGFGHTRGHTKADANVCLSSTH
jgi:hypothetical protein